MMKHMKKIFVILMALGLCGTMAACSSAEPETADESAQTETAAEDNEKDEETSEAEAETEEDDIVQTANIGIIASSMDRDVTNEFVNAVQTNLSEQYPDQIGEVFAVNAQGNSDMLNELLLNFNAMWDGENTVILLVNDEEKGFSDEDLLTFLESADDLQISVGVDHTIGGAPESSFVYDTSDVAGLASLLMENALK